MLVASRQIIWQYPSRTNSNSGSTGTNLGRRVVLDDDEASNAAPSVAGGASQASAEAGSPQGAPRGDEDAIADLYGDEREDLDDDGVDGEDLFGDDMEKYEHFTRSISLSSCVK